MMLSALASPAAAPEIAKPAPEVAPAPAKDSGTPGVPPVVNSALERIQSEGVLGSIIVVLFFTCAVLGGVIWKRQGAMDKALDARDTLHANALKDRDAQIEKARDEWDSQLAELHEARLSLFREVMTALGSATAVIQMHSQSTDQRTASADKLRDMIGELVATSSASRAQFLAIAQNLERQGHQNATSLERLSWKSGAS